MHKLQKFKYKISMKIIVLKFGGTSVGTLDRIKKVSKIIISYIKKKYKVIGTDRRSARMNNWRLERLGIEKKIIFEEILEGSQYNYYIPSWNLGQIIVEYIEL